MKEEYKYEKHQFVLNSTIGKQYCVKCGLISTTNPFTTWAVQKGCDNEQHSSYKRTRKKHTNRFLF